MPEVDANLNISTGNLCSGAQWTKLVFSKDPVAPSTFQDVTHWKVEDMKAYAKDDILPREATSLAFIALAVVLLIGFIMWRLLRCCCITTCCKASCKEKQALADSEDLLTGRRTIVMKVLIFVAMLLASGFMVYGIVTIDKTLIKSGWNHIDDVTVLAIKIKGDLSSLRDRVALIPPSASCLVSEMPPGEASVTFTASSLQSSASNALAQLNGAINKVQDFLQKIANFRSDYYDTSTKANDIWPAVAIGIFCAASACAGILGLFVMIHCPAGIAVGVILTLLLSIVYFILTAGLSAGFIVLGDTCPAVPEIALLNSRGSQYMPLIEFYLATSQPVGQSVSSVLKGGGIVDVDQILQQVAGEATRIQGLVPAGLATPQATSCLSVLASASPLITQGVNTLVTDSSYATVNAVYASSKAWACCEAPKAMLDLWICMVGLGWMCMLLSFFAFVFLDRLDQVPESGCCCSCKCLTPARMGYSKKVTPEPAAAAAAAAAAQPTTEPPQQRMLSGQPSKTSKPTTPEAWPEEVEK